jgi:hypothetical protein
VSGGYDTLGPKAKVFGDESFGSPSWTVLASNFEAVISAKVTAIAYCAPAGNAIAASVDTRGATSARVQERIKEAESAELGAHEAERQAGQR